MEHIQAELISFIIVLLTALIGYATKQVSSYFKKSGMKQQLDNNKVLVNIVVHAVEQMYKEFNGSEKLHMAKLEMIDLLQKKKIKITEKEVDLLIESAVNEMKANAKAVPFTDDKK